MHLPHLFIDLALILGTSAIVSLLFRWLRQPIVLGYILAGILVGPHITFLPTVADAEGVKIWAELGVVFLLFLVGLEFTFRKMFKVGKSAIIASAFEVLAMIALGFGLGLAIGWNFLDSLFLGSALAISSTTIIIKVFEEQGVKTQAFAQLVFGILIIEDLFAILLLAILSTVAGATDLGAFDLLKQIGLLFLSLAIGIPAGMWLTPRLFGFIRSQMNDEIRVIVALALCLGMVVAVSKLGFSSALGAFLMGAFMGETTEGARVEHLLKPIRDLFGAIFFTSVGMLVDIRTIGEHWEVILLISAVTVVGKVLFTAVGAYLGGQTRVSSFQAGLSLGQIGEFSFVIASLALTLGVGRSDLYPMIVAVALITTFATPYLIRLALKVGANGAATKVG